MNKVKIFYILLLSLAVLVSCQQNPCKTKDQFIASYDTFIEDVKTHHEELANADWADIDAEYKQFIEECYEQHREEMSVREKVNFWKNTLSYSTYHTGDEEALEELVGDLQIKLEADLQSFSAESRAEIEDYFRKEVAPQLEDAIDDILRGVEEFGDKLKEWLDEVENN